jgi:O-antigen/teichoic acid export membrane protein
VVLTQVRQAALRGLDRPALAQLPDSVVNPVVQVALLVVLQHSLVHHLSAPAAAFANGVAWLVAFAIGTAFLYRHLPAASDRPPVRFTRDEWLRMVGPLILTGALYNVVSKGDLFVLGALSTSRNVGLYAVASRTAEQTMLIVYTAASLAGPAIFSRIYASGTKAELQRFTTLVTRLMLWPAVPLYVALMVGTPWLLRLFGAEFVAATGVMRLLITAFFLSSLTGFVILMLYMTGHQRDVAVVMFGSGLLNLGLAFVLIPPLGLLGAGIASAVALLVMHGSLAVVLYRRVGVVAFPVGGRRIAAESPAA